ncbi:MAG: DUF2863 family protein [Rhodocyclaceae bacterium]|nr:DUF2863 family protein [Rhodocyclaceae bacterium]
MAISSKRPPTRRRSTARAAAARLCHLAGALAEAGSRIEEQFWDCRLGEAIDKLLAEYNDDAFSAALDQLYDTRPAAYDALLRALEDRIECASLLEAGEEQIVLLAIPVLIWSRYDIPTPVIPAPTLAALRAHLQAHVLASDAQVVFANLFFSPDQLPRSYVPTAVLAAALGEHLREGRQDMPVDPADLPRTERFLSDIRYAFAAVAVKRDAPLFIWQEDEHISREKAGARWAQQGGACISPLFPGCALEFVLPETYFAACARADDLSRAHSLRAAATFLCMELDLPAASLRAVIAPFRDQEFELQEYRISFAARNNADSILFGIVWPLLVNESEHNEIAGEIEKVLRATGVSDIVQIEHPLLPEYCDDCSAPLFPTADGDLAHAEIPEPQNEPPSRHLH